MAMVKFLIHFSVRFSSDGEKRAVHGQGNILRWARDLLCNVNRPIRPTVCVSSGSKRLGHDSSSDKPTKHSQHP